MEIDEIRILVAEPGRHTNNRIKGFVTIAVGSPGRTLVIKDVRIVHNDEGRLVIFWPNKLVRGKPDDPRARVRYDANGNPSYYHDTTHPADAETRAYFDGAILTAYRNALVSGLSIYTEHPGRVTRDTPLRVVRA